MSTQDSIDNSSIVNVNIDPSNMLKVLQKINQIIKDQERRICILENNFVSNDKFKEIVTPLSLIIDANSKRIEKSLTDTKKVSDEMIKSQKALDEKVETKFCEMLFAANNTTKQSFVGLQDSLNLAKENFENSQKKLAEELEATTSQFNEESADMTTAIQTLSDKIKHVHSEFLRHCSQCNKPDPAHNSGASSQNDTSSDDVQAILKKIQQLEHSQKDIMTTSANAEQKANYVYDQVVKLVNDKLSKLQQSLSVALLSTQALSADSSAAGSDPSSSKMAEIWSALSQQKSVILNTISEQNKLSEKIDTLATHIGKPFKNNAPPPLPMEMTTKPKRESILVHQINKEPETNKNLDYGVQVKEQHQLATTVDGLGDRMTIAIQDIQRIKNAVTKNEKNVRDVVLAIIDEFKLIHGNASGLENLPPLNLAQCVPSFFNNPSFTFDRGEESGYSTANTDDYSMSRSVSYDRFQEIHDTQRNIRTPIKEETTSSQPSVKKVSGLLRLVCCPQFKVRREIIEAADHADPNDRSSENSNLVDSDDSEEEDSKSTFETQRSSSRIGTELRSKPGTASSSRRPKSYDSRRSSNKSKSGNHVHFSTSNVDIGSLVKKYENQKFDEYRILVNQFITDKDTLMSAVDRKVDRDMVERLFNKFRTLIHGLNERVNEMAEMMHQFATQEEVNTVAKAISAIPSISEKLANAKTAPEVLKCSRARSRLTGHSTPNRGSVQTVQGNKGGAPLIYNDSMSDSMPKFRLPPLKETATKVVPI